MTHRTHTPTSRTARRLTLTAAVLAACILSVAAQLYNAGERLTYKVAYRAKLIPNTEMATVEMATTLDTLDGRMLYKVSGCARIMSAFRWFFDVEDKYTIWVDTLTKRTQRFESDIREGDYTFRSRYRYDWDAMQVHTWAQSRDKEPRENTIALTANSMDAISLYFNLRSLEPEDFDDGKTHTLEMVLDTKIKMLRFRYLGREECRVPKRGRFRALKFACTLGSSEEFSFTDGTEFLIWITDDRNKFPLMLESPVRVGRVRAYISGYEGLRYPLDCKVK